MKNRITFAQEDDLLLLTLKQEVERYFKNTSSEKFADTYVLVKGFVFLLLYFSLSMCIFFSSSLFELYTCYALMGPLTVFIALNIGHEAAHNILFKTKWMNKMMVHVFDLLGANSQIWKYKHVHFHHPFTNIHEVDLELKQPDIVRIFPYSKKRIIHKYQHFYMPFLYSIYTLVWFLIRDFKDFYELKNTMCKAYPMRDMFIFYFGKLIFISRMILLPALILPFSLWEIIIGFLLCNIIASITTTFALISTHVGEHTEFPKSENGKIPHSWIRHQFLTTTDFAVDSSLITALYGGFNHHLTHHLFPYVSHVHYPAITKIIAKVKAEFGIADHSQNSIFSAIRSHFRLLKVRAKEGKEILPWMEI